MSVKHKKLEIIPCSEYTMEEGKPKCKSGHISMFGICRGHPEGSFPYCMREEPPEHLYEDGLPIGWKLAEKKYKQDQIIEQARKRYKEGKEKGLIPVTRTAKECQEHYEQSVFYRGQNDE